MRKFIPIFSITIASVCMQSCSNRDEDITSSHDRPDDVQKTLLIRQDSTKSPEQISDPEPDPPVRDGDNWRPVQIIDR
ncbi:hypothetical protein J3D55_002389 [Chryseobacterium ginsenosidimutans]|jgi:hypothetical protein|nr:hypothetical protein [Chryseobacterium ginsenosidimutans]